MYEKKFTLTKRVMTLLNSSKSNEPQPEMHFGVPWSLHFGMKDEHLGVYLKCNRKKDERNPWSIDATIDFRLVSVLGTVEQQLETSYTFTDDCVQGFPNFISRKDEMADTLYSMLSVVECNVVINKTMGLAPKRLRNFEEPKKHLTDVILKVEDQKFHVSKAVLANQSPYFEAMFFGKFDDAKKQEIELKETAVDAFQSFLEIIYGDSEITAHNAPDLLILAQKFDVQLIINKCEKFLQDSDQVDKKEKLRLADAFKLKNLLKNCLESIKKPEELKAILPKNLADLSPPTVFTLFEKIVSQI